MSDVALVRKALRNFAPGEPDAEDPIEKEFLPVLAKLRQERRMSRWVGTKGDIVVMLSHVAVDGHGSQPALFLYNRNRPNGKPVVVPLSHLWLMLEDPDTTVQVVRDMAEKLFGVMTRTDCIRIQDALFDFAEDLKNAPPAHTLPTSDWMQAIAEDGLASRINGETVCN